MVTGLLIAGLLQAILLVMSGRESSIQKIVNRQTIDLHREINQRKLSEQQQQKIESLAKERESLLNGLYEMSPVGIALSDMHGHFIECNLAFQEICGYSADELKNLDYRQQLIPKNQTAAADTQMQNLLSHGNFGPYETEYIAKDGQLVDVRLSGSIIKKDDGQHYIWTIVENIKPQKEVERKLKEAAHAMQAGKEAAEALAQAKTIFLANMSHEIRTPMNGVLGLSELALSSQDNHEIQAYLQEINSCSTGLLGILNDILDLSRLESHKIQIENKAFRLDQLLDSINRVFSLDSQKSGVSFNIHCQDKLAINLIGDSLRVRQVLSNLLSNAFKFTKKGHISLSVSQASDPLATQPNRVRLSFRIKDSGIGITKEQSKMIFDPFSQADSSITRQFGGTGLGLAISRQLAQTMGGDVRIESSEIGIGTTFIFEADFENDSHANQLASTPVGKQAENAELNHAALNGKLILLVEDNRINQIVITKMLDKFGLIIDVAENGALALARLEEKAYDLILMDVQMPVMDGLEATRQIRQSKAHGKLPIIAMSAGVTLEEKHACQQAGMDSFIAKPTVLTDLIKALIKQLDRQG
jgi:PAS domain S-box-containing protein